MFNVIDRRKFCKNLLRSIINHRSVVDFGVFQERFQFYVYGLSFGYSPDLHGNFTVHNTVIRYCMAILDLITLKITQISNLDRSSLST